MQILRMMLLQMVLAIAAAWPVQAAEQPVLRENGVVLEYGSEKGPRAVLTFDKNRAAKAALTVETFLAGVAGSKVSIFVDKDPKPAFTHIFSNEECRFEAERSHCTVVLGGRVTAYGRLLDNFRRGRMSKLQVETGGVMAMSHETTLLGFSNAYRAVKE